MLNLIIFISPVLLLIITGILVRARGNSETAGRRYFLFLTWTTIGSLALTLLNWIFPRSIFGYGMALFPVIPGLVVLTLLHWREWNALSRWTKIPILSAGSILLVTIFAQLANVILNGDIYQRESLFFGMALLTVAVFMFIVWRWGKRSPLLLVLINVLYLTIFLAFDLGSLPMFTETAPGQMHLHALGMLAYLTIPGLTIPVMAMLTAGALNTSSTTDEIKKSTWSPILVRLTLFIILLGLLLYVFRWLWLWDGTEDGIRILFIMMVSVIAAISGTLIIILTVSGWSRWAGAIFAMVVIGSIYFAIFTGFGFGEESTNYSVTEERALRIQESIEDYRTKNGNYPMELDDLVPGEMWRVPLPMIMPGQGWCYQGGSNYYRLGAVYREHWSSPYLEVRVYASAGNVPQGNWECDEKLAEVMSQNSFYSPPPTPDPLPASEVSVPRVVVEPILQARSFSVGDWSPDGKFLVFGSTEYFMTDGIEHVTIDLRFLDVDSGEICQPSQSKWTVGQSNGLRDHSAWLSDGRFLYVTETGAMTLFRPCADEVEDLTDRYPVKFTHVMSSDEEGGHILLKNEEAYWLMDGINLEVRKIEGVPTESYRPWYDWSPGGGRLALSLMSGAEIEDEAFLYIVDWASAQVEDVIPLEGASDANLPIVEWLTRDELLLHGNTLTVLDFRPEPPAVTDVLHDIFLLDIAYPFDVSSMDSVRLQSGDGYYIGVQVNHPRNTDAYVYSSETGQVEVFQHDVSTLLFFDDGQWMRLLKWEDEPTYRDEYELVWMDRSNEKTRLKVEGHVPRAHPQLFPRYLPNSSQLVFHSSQGISLVSIPDGKTTAFWELSSHAEYFDVFPSPFGEGLIVASDGDGLYYIPHSSK
ncbi:MAG: hypothetical protein C3F07_02675 [Anaerolineales bacterium]|nr:MAG: hypothetical protein C3F07_02675 [Anaerolineales bacterium]